MLRPNIHTQKPGVLGWGVIGLVVCVWDGLVADSLTQAFRRGGPTAMAAWLVTTAHLFGLLPERVDPFVRIMLLMSHRAQLTQVIP